MCFVCFGAKFSSQIEFQIFEKSRERERERERERDFKRERVVDIYIDEKTTKFKEEFCILTSILSQTDDDECSKTGWRFREIVLDVD